jgi:hypothetical protein
MGAAVAKVACCRHFGGSLSSSLSHSSGRISLVAQRYRRRAEDLDSSHISSGGPLKLRATENGTGVTSA